MLGVPEAERIRGAEIGVELDVLLVVEEHPRRSGAESRKWKPHFGQILKFRASSLL